MLAGIRISLTIAALAALAAVVVGTLVGLLAGTLGGRVDTRRDARGRRARRSQNHFLFGILLIVLFRPALGGAGAVMLAVGLTHWPSLARIVRGELLSVRERPFVAAAIGGGANRRRLARRHYLPHLLPAVGLAFVLTVPHAIFHESAYSFLGLGLQAHQASLGNILADGQRSLLAGGWWIALFPGLAILLASATIGDARRALARTTAPTLAIGAGAMTLLGGDGPLGRVPHASAASCRRSRTTSLSIAPGELAARRRRERERQDRARALAAAAAAAQHRRQRLDPARRARAARPVAARAAARPRDAGWR